jgi:hypothetical protein
MLASPGLLAAWAGSTGESALVATLSVIAFVCRLPAFAFQAVQGPLLRAFSLRVSDGHRVQLRRDLRLVVFGTVLLTCGVAAGGAGLAPVLNDVVAKGAPAGRTSVAMLFSGGVMILGALASQVLVICVHARSRGAGAWALASILGIFLATTLPFALDVRIALSFAAGAGCAFVLLAGSAQRSIASSPGA